MDKNNLLVECSPNGGVKWFELGVWTDEKDYLLKYIKKNHLVQNYILLLFSRDHYVSLISSCQAKNALYRWRNSSIQVLNVAFVKSNIQNYFMDEFQVKTTH